LRDGVRRHGTHLARHQRAQAIEAARLAHGRAMGSQQLDYGPIPRERRVGDVSLLYRGSGPSFCCAVKEPKSREGQPDGRPPDVTLVPYASRMVLP
jgi:hypothetical protein